MFGQHEPPEDGTANYGRSKFRFIWLGCFARKPHRLKTELSTFPDDPNSYRNSGAVLPPDTWKLEAVETAGVRVGGDTPA
jgi:hypothetical protein